jgi:hypothetical protein
MATMKAYIGKQKTPLSRGLSLEDIVSSNVQGKLSLSNRFENIVAMN